MKYLLQRLAGRNGIKGMPQGGGGIMSLQRSYATLLDNVMRDRKLTLEGAVSFLRKDPSKLSDDEWVLLHKIFRRPKPTYVKGLTTAAQKFIERRAALIRDPEYNKKSNSVTMRTKPEKISLEGVSLSVTARPIPSPRARKVQEAFGIVSTEFQVSLINDLSIRASSGDIILVSGPSGTGKSLLLRAVRWLVGKGRQRGRLPENVTVAGHSNKPRVKVASLGVFPRNLSPIDLLQEFPLEDALQILASAGLAEPQLFVRPAGHLSVGQAYRLALALALAESPELLLIDQFCEPLDRFSAFAVCKRLRRAIQRKGICALVATSTPEKVHHGLEANQELVLSSTGEARWLTANKKTGAKLCRE
jgi:ABC-type ATPase with predicted acetyltransferase domain